MEGEIPALLLGLAQQSAPSKLFVKDDLRYGQIVENRSPQISLPREPAEPHANRLDAPTFPVPKQKRDSLDLREGRQRLPDLADGRE